MEKKILLLSFFTMSVSLASRPDWLDTSNLLKKLEAVRTELGNDINIFSGVKGNLEKLSSSLETMQDIRQKAFTSAKECIDKTTDAVTDCQQNYANISIAGSIKIAELNKEIRDTIDDRINNEKSLNAEINRINEETTEKEITTATLINLTTETANEVVKELELIRKDYQKLVEVRTPAMDAIDEFTKDLKVYLGNLSETLDKNSDEYCDKKNITLEQETNSDEQKTDVNNQITCECQK